MKNRVYYRFADGSRVSMEERKGEREILVFAEDWPNAAVEFAARACGNVPEPMTDDDKLILAALLDSLKDSDDESEATA